MTDFSQPGTLTQPGNFVIVSVLSGTVQVSDGSSESSVQPYEKAIYVQNAFSKEATDLSELAWNDRTIRFEDTPLEQVVEKLLRHYEVRILLAHYGLKKCALTGTFTTNRWMSCCKPWSTP